jgi:hypothetical protein
VRGNLDDSLIYLTEQLVSAGIPISHAVEPANLSRKVIEWLMAIKAAHPDRIEILQHGYEHRIKTQPPYRGEFGGNRTYKEQLDEIRKGMALMSTYFADRWTPIFSFPYGTYDHNTLKALEMCGFKIISTGIRLTSKRRILNCVGHMLKVSRFMGYNIVYFSEKKTRLFFIRVSCNAQQYQTADWTGCRYSDVPPRVKRCVGKIALPVWNTRYFMSPSV